MYNPFRDKIYVRSFLPQEEMEGVNGMAFAEGDSYKIYLLSSEYANLCLFLHELFHSLSQIFEWKWHLEDKLHLDINALRAMRDYTSYLDFDGVETDNPEEYMADIFSVLVSTKYINQNDSGIIDVEGLSKISCDVLAETFGVKLESIYPCVKAFVISWLRFIDRDKIIYPDLRCWFSNEMEGTLGEIRVYFWD